MSEYYEGLQISIQTITHVLNSRGYYKLEKIKKPKLTEL